MPIFEPLQLTICLYRITLSAQRKSPPKSPERAASLATTCSIAFFGIDR
jgi:hypothetical protein